MDKTTKKKLIYKRHKYGLFDEFIVAIVRWNFYRSGISYFKFADDDYHYWYPFWHVDIKVGWACFMAFWKRSEERTAFWWLPLYINEYFMDIFGRYLDLFVTFSFWSNFVYHYYWYPLWFTTLQIGSFGIVSFWKRYRDGIEFEKRFSFSYN